MFIFASKILYSEDSDYLPLSQIVSDLNLKIKYNYSTGLVHIENNKKNAKLLINSSYIFLGSNKIFLNNYIITEQGNVLLKYKTALIIYEYFSSKKYNFTDYTKNTKNKNSESYFLNIKNNKLISQKNTKNDDEEINNENMYNDKNKDESFVNKYIYEKPKEIKINAIIIDPGHGGNDPGAVGFSGTKEKNTVLKISLILKDKLKKKYPDKKIIMTRDKDFFPSLEKRSKIANYVFNKYGHSLFISIHVNASRSSKSYGFETWYLVEEYRRNIIKKGEISNDKDVEEILNSMLNDEIYKESKSLANKIQKKLEENIGYVSRNRGIKEQTYFVIKKSIMPAVLVEVGFNTNKYEEIRLTKYNYLNKIAEGIFQGIMDFTYEYERTYGYTK